MQKFSVKTLQLNKLSLSVFLLLVTIVYGQTSNVAPILNATGNQIYCPGTSIKIVSNMSIVDPDDLGVAAIYIQISTGYFFGQDLLTLTGSHPNIFSNWDINSGKLSLYGNFGQAAYTDLVAAIEDVEYTNSASNPSGSRTFSISIGQANYLPSNGHYYQYIPNIGVNWSTARTLAQASTYYGLQGYLATLTAADESQLAGNQASGAGWIGGSDEQQEGIWKWVTGPETGTNMVYTFWNNGEPNNYNNEDYAHITAPGVGISGSWNDLQINGDPSGDYQPKGYIVEYGGMPGDPIIQIATSTTITIPNITSITSSSICDPGSVTLQATSNVGLVNWYTTSAGGTPIATGNSFTTPILSTTTTYFVDALPSGCTTGLRSEVIANINLTPVVSVNTPNSLCSANSKTITATTTAGIIYWYDSMTAITAIASGTSFTTPILSQDTTYYVEGNNNGCLSATRIPVTITLYPLPIVTDETEILCENKTIELDASLTNVTYLWSTLETTKTIQVSNPGIYTVTVTSPATQNCSSIKTITVIEHNTPILQDILVENDKATIIINGFGDFEYSIDDINYQNSNVFTIDEGGLYTAYVREKNDCGFDFKTFIILSTPNFFTPNNDGNNDTWTIKGFMNYSNATVKIFDRFGKLITKLNTTNNSWDGTINGKSGVADDYWYVFKLDENSPEIKGHFSLKR